MTRKELASRLNAHEKKEKRLSFWLFLFPLLCVLGIGFSAGCLFDRIPEWFGKLLGGLLIVIAFGIPLSWLVLEWTLKKLRRAQTLACPACGNSLYREAGRWAVVTLRCVRCEARIVEESEEESPCRCHDERKAVVFMERPSSESGMMTRGELTRRIRAFHAGANIRDLWGGAVWLSSLIGCLVLLIKTKTADAADKGALYAGISGLMALITGTILMTVLLEKRRRKALGLFCPSCETPLDGHTGSLAVATLHCSGCGNRIVEDDDDAGLSSLPKKSQPRPAPLLTRAELTQRMDAYCKKSLKTGWPMLGAFFAASLGCWALLWSSAVQDTRIAWLGLALMLAKGYGWLFVRARQGKKWLKAFGLECPSCQARLDGSTGNIALRTLHCCECGARIIAEETDGPPAPDTSGPEAAQKLGGPQSSG